MAMADATARLRDRIDELEEEIRQLKAAFAPKVGFPRAWGLTPSESTMLSALQSSRGNYVTAEALLLAVEGFDGDHYEADVRTWIGKLRRKLAAYRIEIVTRHREGFALTPESRTTLARLLGKAPDPFPMPPARPPQRHYAIAAE